MTTKDTILVLLCKNRGFFISGEYVAHELGITRTAVWKAIKKLQDEGYDITAVTNRGYCLSKDTDLLYSQGISKFLDKDTAETIRTEVFISTDSTEERCLEKASRNEKEGYVAVSCSQPPARSRKKEFFYSPADTGVQMSVYLKPEGVKDTEVMRLAFDALHKAVDDIFNKEASLHDGSIYANDKKVGRISGKSNGDTLIINIALNIFPPVNGFPEQMDGELGTVADKKEEPVRNKLVAEILNNLIGTYKKAQKSAL